MKEQIDKHEYLRYFAKDSPGWRLAAMCVNKIRWPWRLVGVTVVWASGKPAFEAVVRMIGKYL